jgi:CRISPR-associated protein Csx3
MTKAMIITVGGQGKIKFNVVEKKTYSIVHFELDEAITPGNLVSLNPPKVNLTKGVILSGRGPIWLYCYLTHYYHPSKFIASYDPRVGGAVIVESHSSEYKVGEIIKSES